MSLVNTIIQFVSAHYVAIGVVSAYFFTAAVASLPKPGSGLLFGAAFYQFLFDFFHIVSNKVVERYPRAAATVTTSTVSQSAAGTVSTTEKVSVPAPVPNA